MKTAVKDDAIWASRSFAQGTMKWGSSLSIKKNNKINDGKVNGSKMKREAQEKKYIYKG